MDKLFPNWKYETIPRQVWAMVKTQNKSNYHQAMENTKTDLYKSTKIEYTTKVFIYR